jgi:hypothetical protein
MPPCHYVAKYVKKWYHHCKFFTTGINFGEDGVERNLRERVDLGEIFILWVPSSITELMAQLTTGSLEIKIFALLQARLLYEGQVKTFLYHFKLWQCLMMKTS